MTLLAATVGWAGCAGNERGWASNERDYKAKKFGYPHRDQAKIYVYRESACVVCPPILGAIPFKMQLFLDGVPFATTERGSFVVLRVKPGRHTLVSRFQGEDASLEIDATGGWVYYVAQEKGTPGSMTGSELLLVDRETGREAVRDLNLLDPVPPTEEAPQPPPPRLSGGN